MRNKRKIFKRLEAAALAGCLVVCSGGFGRIPFALADEEGPAPGGNPGPAPEPTPLPDGSYYELKAEITDLQDKEYDGTDAYTGTYVLTFFQQDIWEDPNYVPPTPTDAPTPTEDPNPTGDAPTPTEDPNPTGDATPTEDPNPTGDATPTEDPNPTGDATPTEDPNPTGDATPTEDPNPTGDATPTEDPNPTGDATPTEDPNPTGDATPTENPNPTGDATPTGEPPVYNDPEEPPVLPPAVILKDDEYTVESIKYNQSVCGETTVTAVISLTEGGQYRFVDESGNRVEQITVISTETCEITQKEIHFSCSAAPTSNVVADTELTLALEMTDTLTEDMADPFLLEDGVTAASFEVFLQKGDEETGREALGTGAFVPEEKKGSVTVALDSYLSKDALKLEDSETSADYKFVFAPSLNPNYTFASQPEISVTVGKAYNEISFDRTGITLDYGQTGTVCPTAAHGETVTVKSATYESTDLTEEEIAQILSFDGAEYSFDSKVFGAGSYEIVFQSQTVGLYAPKEEVVSIQVNPVALSVEGNGTYAFVKDFDGTAVLTDYAGVLSVTGLVDADIPAGGMTDEVLDITATAKLFGVEYARPGENLDSEVAYSLKTAYAKNYTLTPGSVSFSGLGTIYNTISIVKECEKESPDGKYYPDAVTVKVEIPNLTDITDVSADVKDSTGATYSLDNESFVDGTYYADVTLSAEETYYVEYSATLNGESELAGESFTIDLSAPVLKMEPDGWSGTGNISQDSVDIKLTVTDNEPFPATDESLIFTVEAYDTSDTRLTEAENAVLDSFEGWSENTGEFTNVFHLTESARYEISAKVVDAAGIISNEEVLTFYIDKDAPGGKIIVENTGAWETFFETVTFGLFKANDTEVTIEGADKTSSISEIEYYVSNEMVTLADLEALSATDWTVYTDPFTISPTQKYVIYARITDAAGRFVYINSDGVVLDDVPPTITLNGQTALQKDSSEAIVHVEEMGDNGVIAGLSEITYRILVDEVSVTEGSFAITPGDTSFDGTIPVASSNNSNNIRVEVTAKDRGGKSSTESLVFSIDEAKPVISYQVTGGKNSESEKNYYRDAVTLAISVQERNFDPASTTIVITKDGAPVAPSDSPVSWTRSDSGVLKDTSEYVQLVTLTGEGVYSISVNSTDLAGNAGTTLSIAGLTVDRTPPVLSVSYDNNTASGSMANAFNLTRTATVTVKEHNFNPDKAKLSVIQKDSAGNQISNGTYSFNGNWTNIGTDTYSAKVVFNGSANYEFVMTVEDRAGNSRTLGTQKFSIDKDAPKGTVSVSHFRSWENFQGLLNFDRYYKDSAEVTLSASDATTGVASIQYIVSDRGMTMSDLKESTAWKAYSGAFNITPNGNYVIYEKVTDRAGNIAYYSSNGMILDASSPDILIVVSEKQRSASVYGSDVTLNVDITDLVKNNSYSGIANASYEVYNGSVVTQSGTIQIPADNSQKISKDITIEASKNNSNDVKLVVYARDKADNSSSKSYSVKVDITDPYADYNYVSGTDSEYDSRYFNQPIVLDMTVEERNFNPSKVVLSVEKDGQPVENAAAYWTSEWAQTPDSPGAGSDSAKVSRQLTFDRDGTYRVSMRVEDAAGNDDSVSIPVFTIDRTRPVIDIRYDSYEKTGQMENAFNHARVATITVNEHNFKPEEMSLTVVQKDIAGNAISDAKYSGWSADAWTNNGDEHTISLMFGGSANYEVVVSSTDKAGNHTDAERQTFVIDTAETDTPSGSITFGEMGLWSTFLHTITFGLYTNHSQTVTIDAGDSISGIGKIEYILSPVEKDDAQLAEEQNWVLYGGSFRADADEKVIVYAKISDNAGNVKYISSDGVIIDATAPVANMTVRTGASSFGMYNSDVSVALSVSDANTNDSFAGISSAKYEVYNGDKVTQEGTLPIPASGNGRIGVLEDTILIKSEDNNSDNIRVVVYTEDRAGNTAKSEMKCVIDTSAPEVSVLYSAPSSDRYYGNSEVCTATITVYERNFSPELVTMNVLKDGQPVDASHYSVSPWTEITNQVVADRTIHKVIVTFDKDGDYSFDVTCHDEAMNTATYHNPNIMTVDRTAPKFKVNADIIPTDSYYYRKNPSVTVTVDEHNFDPSGYSLKLEGVRASDGSVITEEAVKGGWKNNGDNHTYTFDIEEEGEYLLRISGVDLATNAQSELVREFILDKGDPSISVRINNMKYETLSNKAMNNKKIDPVIMVSDNYAVGDVDLSIVKLEGTEKKEISVPEPNVVPNEFFEGCNTMMTWDFGNLKEDGIYLISVSAKDKAGNVTKSFEDMISVNRNGSTFFLKEGTKAFDLVSTITTNKPLTEPFVIYESNVNQVGQATITVETKRNGTRILEEGIDYDVLDVQDSEYSLHEISYSIHPEVFAQEEHYTVSLISVDEAENHNDSQKMIDTKGDPIVYDFFYDITPPSLQFEGIENNATYNQDRMSFRINTNTGDMTGIAMVYVTVDGLTETYGRTKDATKTLEADGYITITLNSSSTRHQIEVKAVDGAGNENEGYTYRVTVTTNTFLLFLSNKASVIRTSVGAVLILLLSIALVFVKKNEKKAK